MYTKKYLYTKKYFLDNLSKTLGELTCQDDKTRLILGFNLSLKLLKDLGKSLSNKKVYEYTHFQDKFVHTLKKKRANQEKLSKFNKYSFMKKTIRKAIMHRFNPLFTMASYLIQTLELLVFLSKLSYAIAKKWKI